MRRTWNRVVITGIAFAISGCSVLIGLRDDYAGVVDDTEAGTSSETGATETGTVDGGRDAPPDGLAATCGNAVKDGTETDIDCGGDQCLPCRNAKACVVDRDCVSGACDAGCKPWVQSYGTQGASVGDMNGVAVGPSGDIAVCGTLSIDVDFGNGNLPAGAEADVVVAKLASNGTPRWSRRFGGGGALCSSIAMDAAGNVVIGGTYFDGALFTLGGGTLPKVSGSEAYVGKLAAANGAPIWVTPIATSGIDRVYGVSVDANGDVLATGQIGGQVSLGGNNIGPTNNTPDIVVAKLASATGVATWAKSYGSIPGSGGSNGTDIGRAVATDTKGNVFVTGSFRGTSIGFGVTTLTASAEHDAFVLALSPAGTALWATRYGSANPFIAGGPEEGFGIATDGAGNVFVTGRVAAASSHEAFVAKLAPDGGLAWDAVRGGSVADLGNAVSVDPDGNALVVGRFDSPTLDFAPDASLANAEPAGGKGDVFLVKMAGADGRLLFAESYGGTEIDNGFGVAAQRGNSVFVGTASAGMTVRGIAVPRQIFVGSLGPLP